MPSHSKKSVLFAGQCYYNAWYLSRELRKLGWRADVLNWDQNENDQMYYHGEDFRFFCRGKADKIRHLKFYLKSLFKYDIFHFSNTRGMHFGAGLAEIFKNFLPEHWYIKLLKRFRKKIVYSNNGCMDGVSQSSFRKWGPEPVCDICRWRDVPEVCSDKRNLAWGKFRNAMADYQITLGGNRADYNDDPRVHEVPQFYCLDHNFWRTDLPVPPEYRLPYPEDTVKIYHAVGNFALRTTAGENKNIKCTHIYLPLIERLKSEGHKIELIFFTDVPNKTLRYYQAQADIFVDMLTYGWFGANVREGMMLGKPCVCFLRPEWLESMRQEIPDYVAELPVVSATPQTIYYVLKDLIEHPDKRKEIGEKSRAFAVKWHSAEAGAKKFDKIYSELLKEK
ncbi:MAG: glycosyltransferase [Planctomycetota bacterium]